MKKNKDIVQRIHDDAHFRRSICLEHHYWFFITYFTDYLTFRCEDMHKKMLYLSQMENFSKMIVLGFPKCGKTLVHSYSLPLWAILSGKAKNIIIAVGNKEEKKLFRDCFERMLMLRKKLKEDFSIQYRRKRESFLFPFFQAQIYIASLDQHSEIENILGRAPDMIIVDPIERYIKEKAPAIFTTGQPNEADINIKKSLSYFLYEAGDSETRTIVLGRGDGGEGIMMNLVDEAEQNKDQECVSMFYPLCIPNKENIFWKAKFPDTAAIDRELEKSETAEDFYFQYCILREFPDLPFRLTAQNYTDTYPIDLYQWSHLSLDQMDSFEKIFFIPYQGDNNNEASILWGVQQKDETYVYQGVLWEGPVKNFDVDQFFVDIRSKLDETEFKPKILLCADESDPFGKFISENKQKIINYSVFCHLRHDKKILKKIILEALYSGRIQFNSSFAQVFDPMLNSGSKAYNRLIHQLSMPFSESLPRGLAFVVCY